MTDSEHSSGTDMPAEDWYGPDAATFGDRLAAARDATGMTQAQLARRLGIKPSTLRAWEDDMSEPRANRLSMIAGILGVSIVWLLTGEGEGLEAPDADVQDETAQSVLREIRDLHSMISQASARLGRLEKQMRRNLASQ